MTRSISWALPLAACIACQTPTTTSTTGVRKGSAVASAPASSPSSGRQVEKGASSALGIERLDPRFDALVPDDAHFEVVAEGFAWLEGPTWRPHTRDLVFSDIPNNRIHAWSEVDGARVLREKSGYTGTEPFTGREPGSNGLTIDAQGRLIICQHGDRQIVRIEADGSQTVLASHYQGRRLNSPNDVIVHSSGALYFTDPPFGLPKTFDDPQRELPITGVYRVVEGQPVELVIETLGAPNGLTFSPDERTLYVSDVDPKGPAWWAYAVNEDGSVGPGKKLVDARPFMAEREGGPDGIEVDRNGYLFTAGPEGVYVFAPDGAHLGTLFTGVKTANLEWGDDGSTLYVAANTRILRIRLSTEGALRSRGPDLIVSANDGKFVRDNGQGTYPPGAGKDSLTVVDAARQPPEVVATVPVRHTIHGPPQSVAVTPDGKLAFVGAPDTYNYRARRQRKYDYIQAIDLEAKPAKLVRRVNVGGHPQGLSISPDGKWLVAATAAGHVAVLSIDGKTVKLDRKIKLSKGKLSGISFTADGRSVLVALRDDMGLAVLEVDAGTIKDTEERLSSGVTPYAIDVSADGRWAVVSNVGLAAIDGRPGRLHGDDRDSLTVIDTSRRPFRAIQFLTTPAIPEGAAMSPDGRYIAAVTMAGSNLPEGAPGHADRGQLALYERRDGRYEHVSSAPTGAASQGVVFTRDSRRLVVQFNLERQLAVYRIDGGKLVDTEHRIPLSGGPTSLGAMPR